MLIVQCAAFFFDGFSFDVRSYAATKTKCYDDGSAKDTKAACQESIRSDKVSSLCHQTSKLRTAHT